MKKLFVTLICSLTMLIPTVTSLSAEKIDIPNDQQLVSERKYEIDGREYVETIYKEVSVLPVLYSVNGEVQMRTTYTGSVTSGNRGQTGHDSKSVSTFRVDMYYSIKSLNGYEGYFISRVEYNLSSVNSNYSMVKQSVRIENLGVDLEVVAAGKAGGLVYNQIQTGSTTTERKKTLYGISTWKYVVPFDNMNLGCHYELTLMDERGVKWTTPMNLMI